ncbi:MAG: hypothetical protein CMJ81_04875 [Planctomycetaceae bacterium]|jgi:hypothetical protein|nr:hypothetical protein [Planctomycetaceae bacterium]MBP61163.1 hypothetical protein [Planctomycetaceae bacterium]
MIRFLIAFSVRVKLQCVAWTLSPNAGCSVHCDYPRKRYASYTTTINDCIDSDTFGVIRKHAVVHISAGSGPMMIYRVKIH